MFLTLARFPELQNMSVKLVSLSGILDHATPHPGKAPMGLKQMFKILWLKAGKREKPGLPTGSDEYNPLFEKIASDPHRTRTADDRIGLAEGKHMVSSLKTTGHQVNYWK